LFLQPDPQRRVVSIGLVDKAADKVYMFEAAPDFAQQAKALRQEASPAHRELPDGIFLTHAHIGHYTGLMYLGKEAVNAPGVAVYAMPRMKAFIEQNGPWSQLVSLGNIALQELHDGQPVKLGERITVTPLLVPHRDEYSETVGYVIAGPNKKALFIPDIDKWQKWNRDIRDEIARVDYAFIDGTFYDAAEIAGRDISTIPHPFVIESMKLFADLPPAEKAKVCFIHFNHTNPLIKRASGQYKDVIYAGFKVARMGQRFGL
jgi:pyrroloquinoline quinone biosynthesis protein B